MPAAAMIQAFTVIPGRRRGDIWISSGLRRDSAGLREFPGFGRLDFLGIPWILSSEMSLINGLRATSRRFFFHAAAFRVKRPMSGLRRRRSASRFDVRMKG